MRFLRSILALFVVALCVETCTLAAEAAPLPAQLRFVRHPPALGATRDPQWASHKYRIIHRFTGTADGAYPNGELITIGGALYGTTSGGGRQGFGTIFRIGSSGAETVLYSFEGGNDGAYPQGGLIEANGMLIGTTDGGGPQNLGTVFEMNERGQERVLYTFGASATDGWRPNDITQIGGALYGTTYNGGTYNAGTVYKLTTAGIETILYNFGSNVNDGSHPSSLPVYLDGSYYGTATAGGSGGTSFCFIGCGTIYRLNRYGRVEETTFNFSGGADGGYILSGLTKVDGKLYGTAFASGVNPPFEDGPGTFFDLDRFGAAHVIRHFKGGTDVLNPWDTLLNVDGVLYGMSFSGGKYGNGTLYKITTAGVVTILHSFAGGADGTLPNGTLVDVNGVLYGATASGGGSACGGRGCGILFSICP